MSRVVYTNRPQLPTRRLVFPPLILVDLLSNRELIVAYTKREFHSMFRGTFLGLAWSVISPLIMLMLFTFVFGSIFGGRFTDDPNESPAEFALALFIGLAFFNCLAQTMGGAPSLVGANSAYVKTLAFPLEILSVSAVLNVLISLAISLGLCLVAFLVMNQTLHWSMLSLVAHVVCIALLSLGVSWFLSSLSVFVRDVQGVIPPISTVLMFLSSIFFPLSKVPKAIRGVAELNPLAVIIDQARSAMLYGRWPDPVALGAVLGVSLAIAVLGYWFFMRAKPAFADVL